MKVLAILTLVFGLSMMRAPWVDIVPLPDGVQPTEGTRIDHDYDEATFLVGTAPSAKRGKLTTGYLTRLPEGSHEPTETAWKKWEPALKGAGWVLKGHEGDSYSLQLMNASGESWLRVDLGEYQDPRLTLVRLSGKPRRVNLVAPAAKVEPASDKQEFPFMKGLAGSTLESTAQINEPLDVTSGTDKEMHLVGNGYVLKQYTPPASLSKLEFELAYIDALKRAGWTVLPRPAGTPEGEGTIRAHYAVKPRDIWVMLGRANDDSNTGMSIAVADLGVEDWSKQLAGQCRLPLYGVTFDFNQSTLKPESDAILQRAAEALTANSGLAIEVQGHTDDVGDDAYNVKLSGQRAETVRTWLGAHGIPAQRLTAKGYGKTQPVVENSSDANRARNRRVELKCAK